MRYVLLFDYLGTRYAGWQAQPNALGVQQLLDEALSKLLRQQVQTLAAGRTDAGVHAVGMLAHFDTEQVPDSRFVHKINGILPPDIRVTTCLQPSKPDFHARFDATSRSYQYFISPQKNPFLQPYTWLRWGSLDVDKMQQAADLMRQHSDFACFAKVGSDNKTTICNIMQARWQLFDEDTAHNSLFPFTRSPLFRFDIQADRFLRGMVRGIVGTMVRVGEGKLSLDQFGDLLLSQNRQLAGSNAPAQGLFFTGAGYPTGSFRTL